MAKKSAKPSTGENPEASPSITKAKAVREALAAGVEAPEEAVAYIKKQFNIDISRQHFSAVKSTIKAKKGTGRSKAPQGYLSPPGPRSTKSGPDLIDAMEAMKPLVASLGVEKVKRIAELLG